MVDAVVYRSSPVTKIQGFSEKVSTVGGTKRGSFVRLASTPGTPDKLIAFGVITN
jgi:hypothetical protein